MNVYLLITHGRHISLITNIVMQWYIYESDLNECTFRKSTQKNDFEHIWHLWPWKSPSNWKSRVASTHTFLIILRLIDLAWMPAINKQCCQRCKISFWLAYYTEFIYEVRLTTYSQNCTFIILDVVFVSRSDISVASFPLSIHVRNIKHQELGCQE